MATSSSTQLDNLRYLIVRPENGGVRDLAKYLVLRDISSGLKFVESSQGAEEVAVWKEVAGQRGLILVSIILRKLISAFAKPMEYTGYVVDFILNLLSQNGNLYGLVCNLFHCTLLWYSGDVGQLVIPRRGTETFLSTVGQMDGRIDLYRGKCLEQASEYNYGERFKKVELGNRALMDLCVMASKLAYENAEVVRNVVVSHWKMHFVGFHNCWNDFQKQMSTQVFVLCDKPEDANLILISFRGTEPFDAGDWSTDFDYSWYEIPELGIVHMGFLEALGLGNRENVAAFQRHLQTKEAKFSPSKSNNVNRSSLESTESISSNTSSGIEQDDRDESSDSEELIAYNVVRNKLKSLLMEHKNAKFVVTGHSLGGALAILFPMVLLLHEEMEVMGRLLGLYTFGQPSVGNQQMGKFMEAHLGSPAPKYFRVVYCNDFVPRFPYDDKTFLYKHFGVCLYYDSCYIEKKTDEVPNKNYFGLRYLITSYLNAVWELIRSLTMGYTYGPEYAEGWFSIFSRIMGLALPGISAHFLTDYVNSVRLGKQRVVQMSSF